jgi:hypothetical protein
VALILSLFPLRTSQGVQWAPHDVSDRCALIMSLLSISGRSY